MGAARAEDMKKRLKKKVTTLIGADAAVAGNLIFDQGCHVAGTVKGDVSAADNEKSELGVAETGRIEGNATAARMLIKGTVVGDLWCSGTVTLTSTACVKGSIEYGQIEMEKGAVVKGQLLMMSSSRSSESAQAAGSDSSPEPGRQMQPSLT